MEDSKQSQFNLALDNLKSLRGLLDHANYLSQLARLPHNSYQYNPYALSQWKVVLKSIKREIVGKLTDNEIKDVDILFSKFNKIPSYMHKITTPEGNYSQINPRTFLIHWNLTDKIDIKLRVLADRHGLLIPDQKDHFGAIEG